MKGNDIMSWVLRSPFHGLLSSSMMLITITGRRSGRAITTPVSYIREGDTLWITSNRDRIWWRNLQGGANVKLLLRRKLVNGFAETEMDSKAVEGHLTRYLFFMPQAARSMGIRMKNKMANAEDIARVAKDKLFVKIKLMN